MTGVPYDELILQFSTTENIWSWKPPFFPNWGSAVIRLGTHSPFSHVDMELPGGYLLGSSNSPNAPVISGNPQGVAVRPSNYAPFAIKKRMVIYTPLADSIRLAALSQNGKPFDGGILRQFISPTSYRLLDWRDTRQWFCSELIVWAMELSGFWYPRHVVQWPRKLITPIDILILMLFDKRWTNMETFWG